MPKKGRDTREVLIDAMCVALRRHGYHGASLNALLRSVQIPKGSMYHYFASKEALVEAVIHERLTPRVEASLLFRRKSGRLPIDAMIEQIEGLKTDDALRRHRLMLLPLLIETKGSEAEVWLYDLLRQLWERIRTSIEALLHEAQEEGSTLPIDPDAQSDFITTQLLASIALRSHTLKREGFVKNMTLLQAYLKGLRVHHKERPKHLQQTLF